MSGVEFTWYQRWEAGILTITTDVRAGVAALLGREPRGLEAIALATSDGSPIVIRVASLVDDRPFPTLFWLVDSSLNYRIDQVEAGGLIKEFQRRIDGDPDLQQQMRADHGAHIALRASYIPDASRQRLEDLRQSVMMTFLERISTFPEKLNESELKGYLFQLAKWDVADAVVYLASDASGYISGVALTVAGGMAPGL